MLAAVILGFGGPAAAQVSRTDGGIVLFTIDTEFPGDAEALATLELDVPATYFWTGSYAQQHPDLLRRIASEGHTIGSHSFHHDDLRTLNARQAQLDLELSKTVIEQIAGVPVHWFRAPYLEYSDAVMQQVAELGFTFDSSDSASRPHNRALREIAISVYENRLVADYDMFETGQLDDATGLDFLIRAFDAHADRGQPLVVLLHPRFIGQHPDVLRRFIAHVRERSGRFMTLDGYVDSLTAQGPRRLGVWVDLVPGGADALLADVLAMGVTDVFLTVPEDTLLAAGGREAFDTTVVALKGRGLRVHAALSVNANAAFARSRPATAMADNAGVRSALWLSPSHPEVRRQMIAAATELVRDSGVDGLHLVNIGYPDLDHDFSPAALLRFGEATGVTVTVPQRLLVSHYLAWTNWRADEILSLVQEIASAVAPIAGPDFELSASLIGEAAIDYRTRERSGQDYARLAGPLDLIVLRASLPFNADPATLRRMIFAARTQVGSAALLTGFDIGDQMLDLAPDSTNVGLALREAFTRSDGAVVSLAPRRVDGKNLFPALRRTIRESLRQTAVPFSLPESIGTAPR